MAAAPRVVIIGGGFGGLDAARALSGAPVHITLADRHNYHLFQPLLYQVATASLSPGDIASPIRWVLRHQRNVEVLLAHALAVDPAAKTVALDHGDALSYDYLILATGAAHAYFGHDEWAARAPGLKTLDDALEMRRRMLLAFEDAERETDPAAQRRLLTFVIIGGGPTGVELAGALAEIARHSLKYDFRRIRPESARILLLEGADFLLGTFPPTLRAAARASLTRLGVEVRTAAKVTNVDASGVQVGDEHIAAQTVLWAAGVAASPLARSLGVPLDRVGRVLAEPTLRVPGHPDIFVVGDVCALQQNGQWLPGVAQVAMQGGAHAAKNVLRAISGERLEPFHYHDFGTMATIGRGSAVGDVFGLKISGWFGWVFWIFLHIFWLIGFRNRLAVMSEWAWAYVTFQRRVRLITGDTSSDP
ncbi:MAG TPA: NAD(P)/FAD-dependent oxidoreductase [Vicinamibacterales bacterium]|nr:NAD(P)/FAD-dependent oxidoreductase [Vicinamibacterales bacterium]